MVNYDVWNLNKLRIEADKRGVNYSAKDGIKTLAARLRVDDQMSCSPEELEGAGAAPEKGEENVKGSLTFQEQMELQRMELEKIAMIREMERERWERTELEQIKETEHVKTVLLKIREMRENEEIDYYFRIFEFTARAQSIPVKDWLATLVPKLTEKAKSTYLELSDKDALDYNTARSLILKSYQLTADHYRFKFRTSEKQSAW